MKVMDEFEAKRLIRSLRPGEEVVIKLPGIHDVARLEAYCTVLSTCEVVVINNTVVRVVKK